MFSSRDIQILKKILRHCSNIRSYLLKVRSIDEFSLNSEKQDAVVFNILQIGELAKEQLSDTAKFEISDIPWNAIIRMRHRLVHHYDSYNISFVWLTATNDIPVLEAAVKRHLSK